MIVFQRANVWSFCLAGLLATAGVLGGPGRAAADDAAAEIKLPAAAVRAQRAFEAAKEKLDRQYAAERKRIDAAYREAAGKLRVELVFALEAAKIEAAQQVRLDVANALRDVIAAVPLVFDPPGADRKAEVGRQKAELPAGQWVVRGLTVYDSGKSLDDRSYEIRGAVLVWTEANVSSRLAIDEAGMIRATRSTGDYEVWRPITHGRYLVDYYHAGKSVPWGTGLVVPRE